MPDDKPRSLHRRSPKWNSACKGIRWGTQALYTDEEFRRGCPGYPFQGRFSSVVLDERNLIAAARYVEPNPVRACMVSHAWEYPWSSAAFHADIRAVDPLMKEKTLPMLVGNRLEFLSCSDQKEMDALRMATRMGRSVGDKTFLNELSNITGKKWHAAGWEGHGKKQEQK